MYPVVFHQGQEKKTASEYIVSGRPFAKHVTHDGSTNELTFPLLTQWVIVTNHGAGTMKVGFSEDGLDSNSNYYLVAAGATTPKFEIRTKSIFYDGTSTQQFSVMAGLTGITTGSVVDLSASTYWGV